MKERADPHTYASDEATFRVTGQKSGGRPLSSIFQDVITRVSEIIRSEIRLAKSEIRTDVQKATRIAVYMGVGAAFAFYALGFVLLAGVYALSLTLAPWLAAVGVAVFAGIVAAIFIGVALGKMETANFRPSKTIESLEDNVTWMKKLSK